MCSEFDSSSCHGGEQGSVDFETCSERYVFCSVVAVRLRFSCCLTAGVFGLTTGIPVLLVVGKKALSESTKKASDEESDPAQQQQQQREQFTPSTAPGSPPQSERPQVSALTHVSSSPLSVKSAHSNASSQVRKDAWAVRPGYSSGASSYEGSDDGRLSDGELYEQERLTLEGSFMDRSRHSNVDGCALGSLRQTIANQGGLTESVVRIETPFGQPIEEVYQGVHDGPVLGSGVSGIVRLIQHRATGLKYAVKILDLGTCVGATEAGLVARQQSHTGAGVPRRTVALYYRPHRFDRGLETAP